MEAPLPLHLGVVPSPRLPQSFLPRKPLPSPHLCVVLPKFLGHGEMVAHVGAQDGVDDSLAQPPPSILLQLILGGMRSMRGVGHVEGMRGTEQVWEVR